MPNMYSADDLFGFLEHASLMGLLPPATAAALAVACRNVLGVLSNEERKNLGQQDLDAVIQHFQNKRAKDFTAPTLKEYGRRLLRTVNLFQDWREDPVNFRPATRATSPARMRRNSVDLDDERASRVQPANAVPYTVSGTYQTTVPLGRDRIVTLLNVPANLTKAEAKRLATFVEMLVVEPSE